MCPSDGQFLFLFNLFIGTENELLTEPDREADWTNVFDGIGIRPYFCFRLNGKLFFTIFLIFLNVLKPALHGFPLDLFPLVSI